jgi:L-alanine-DL-glutamate epimerase-like enolase superfamily enzyme
MPKLADLKLWFIEEPTSPDDILGHAKIRKALKPHGIGVATGEHVNNRVMFKQLLQAEAIDAVQLDALRLSGINEILSVCLLAAKFGVPVVPHSGGTGMPELCNHISHFDFVAISGKQSILGESLSFLEHDGHSVRLREQNTPITATNTLPTRPSLAMATSTRPPHPGTLARSPTKRLPSLSVPTVHSGRARRVC